MALYDMKSAQKEKKEHQGGSVCGEREGSATTLPMILPIVNGCVVALQDVGYRIGITWHGGNGN